LLLARTLLGEPRIGKQVSLIYSAGLGCRLGALPVRAGGGIGPTGQDLPADFARFLFNAAADVSSDVEG